jgi:mediator of RNA polymerase II transcription subunit 17
MNSPPHSSTSPKDHDQDAEDWKGLRLSLERPYKDEKGEKLPILYDIEPDGKFIYETSVPCYATRFHVLIRFLPNSRKETLDDRLKSNLHRIFQERGLDFFDNPDKRFIANVDAQKEPKDDVDMEQEDAKDEEGEEVPTKHMTFEELNAMRAELLPQLQ